MVGKNIYGYEIEGNFIDISTLDSFAQAEKFLSENLFQHRSVHFSHHLSLFIVN